MPCDFKHPTSVEPGFHWTKPGGLKLMMHRWVLCPYSVFQAQATILHPETYDFSAALFCITKDVSMKKMPPALIVYPTLAALIASTPEYIILLDTVICTAAGTQGCKQLCMWLRASRWQLPCSGQYFHCQKTLSRNGEQTGTSEQWKKQAFYFFPATRTAQPAFHTPLRHTWIVDEFLPTCTPQMN